MTSSGPTCSQYTATIGGGHSFTESVLVFSFTNRRLKCSFHNIACYISLGLIWVCKGKNFLIEGKPWSEIYFINSQCQPHLAKR